MAYQHDNGQISIFKNEHKTQDKHPDYKGYGKAPNGTDIEIALWVKEGQKGKFFSGRIEIKQQQTGSPEPQQSQRRQPQTQGHPVIDDDLPF